MCNRLHKNSKPIPKSGIGWKITFLGGYSMFAIQQYHYDCYGWANWNQVIHNGGYGIAGRKHGFCFFRSKHSALKYMKFYGLPNRQGWIISKISYRRGLGTHREKLTASGISVQISLCRSFKFID